MTVPPVPYNNPTIVTEIKQDVPYKHRHFPKLSTGNAISPLNLNRPAFAEHLTQKTIDVYNFSGLKNGRGMNGRKNRPAESVSGLMNG